MRWAAALLVAACAVPPMRAAIPDTRAPAAHDLSGWRGWPRVNPRRFQSKGHGYVWVDVRLPPDELAWYAAPSTPAPPGFRVVMAGYDAAEGGEPRGLTAMVKLPPGSDPAGGDWWYAALAPDGRRATLQGRPAACDGCHRHAAPGDHLFGTLAEHPPPL